MTSPDDFYDLGWPRRHISADNPENDFSTTHSSDSMNMILPPAAESVLARPSAPPPAATSSWSSFEKALFRFAFLYFSLQVVPLDWKYYRDVTVNWAGFSFGDIFRLAHYTPRFFQGPDTFANWAVVALLAVIGAGVWSVRDQNRTEYNTFYYWLRVLVRYRLAAGLLAYGFLKFFPLQAPPPSLSHLNTHYGDLSNWKIFALSLGIVPSYQSFLGLVEILAALLLLNRRTASVGAFLGISFLGNVFLSNLAYEGGEYVYSFYLLALALVVLWYDARRVNDLLTLERSAQPNRFRLQLPAGWPLTLQRTLKASFVLLFVGLYGAKTYAAYQAGYYHYPQTPGLAGAAGLYDVREFRLNGQLRPYSATDPERWQDVVLEKWATLSVRSNRPVVLNHSNTEAIHPQDPDRDYEFAGVAGRHYYAYQLAPDGKTLTLQNRNRLEGPDQLTLRVARPDARTILLAGTDAQGHALEVVLEKRDKKYLLEEAAKTGRRGGLKL
ncbi:DoxX family protein [Hymenobacter volaticus]|uniref:DoxX family protein n=1 Tax=Hymenobacter volaticus TaxID=2932254 RepID=A0ABY4GFL9_9BACT|nr:DoxX family protein [Hymenobacter volaticus]UOQ69674.1 DoxX family protein [Hymenobacter volaticus]